METYLPLFHDYIILTTIFIFSIQRDKKAINVSQNELNPRFFFVTMFYVLYLMLHQPFIFKDFKDTHPINMNLKDTHIINYKNKL